MRAWTKHGLEDERRKGDVATGAWLAWYQARGKTTREVSGRLKCMANKRRSRWW